MSSVEADSSAKPVSRWEDYVDVFFSPAELYARRGHDRVAPAMLTLLALAVIAYYALMPANQLVMRAAMPPEAAAAPGAERMISIMTYLGGITVAITHFVMIAFGAAVLWLVARGVELRPAFRQTMVIATYAGFIAVLAQIAGGVLAMVYGEGLDPMRDLSFGVMRFLDAKALPDVLPSLLRRIDIFMIWQAVLWAIGLRVILGATKVQAAITAAGAWLLFAVPGMIMAALGIGQAVVE